MEKVPHKGCGDAETELLALGVDFPSYYPKIGRPLRSMAEVFGCSIKGHYFGFVAIQLFSREPSDKPISFQLGNKARVDERLWFRIGCRRNS
jgi:hypothetical protein